MGIYILDFDGRGALGATVDDSEGDLAHDFFWYGQLVSDDDGGLALSNPTPDDYGSGEVQVYKPDGSWEYPAMAKARISVDFKVETTPDVPEVPRSVDLLWLNNAEDGIVRKAWILSSGTEPRLEWIDSSDGVVNPFGDHSAALIHSVPLALDRWYRLAIAWNNGNATITVSHGDTIDARFNDTPGGTFQSWFRCYGGIFYDGLASRVRVTIDRLTLRWGRVAPPLRQYPRTDGLATSSARRLYPVSRSRQRSLRHGGGTYL